MSNIKDKQPRKTIDSKEITPKTSSSENIFNTAFSVNRKTPVPIFMKSKSIGSSNSTPKTCRKIVSFDQKTSDCSLKVSMDSVQTKRTISHTDYSIIDGEVSNLTVAVRVRPMNSREITMPAITNIVQVKKNEVIVTTGNTADNVTGVTHSFYYDNVFWSCNPSHKKYSNQIDVFQGTAESLVDKAFEGYNACLFAYGQTGSGKSYSMMGIDLEDTDMIQPDSEAGIIPRFCQEIFNRIENLKKKLYVEVEISFFEIYNEKIHDLLAVTHQVGLINATKKTPLKVREHPVWGPYVVDLSIHPVDSRKALWNWLAVGNSQRATAATGMNDKSSRSHSIFNIVLNMSEINSNKTNGKLQTKRSKISLVDLAGSERIHASHSFASGTRLREGVSINKSLLTLGKVIAALSDSKKSAVFVPYRESVLTWLLRENLGGNSRTVMLATISPASIHLDETLATLRYACQARTIINRVKVNEDPHDRIIRELREEVERLQLLRQNYEQQKCTNYKEQSKKMITETLSDEKEVEILKQQLFETEQELARAQKTWMERLNEADNVRKTEIKFLKRKGLAFEISVEQKQPCLINLAVDPILSGTLLYVIPSGLVRIGRSTSCEIILEGPLVAYQHCSIENSDGKLFLQPENNERCETYLNGRLVEDGRKLFHGDRLIIGGSHFFRIANPHCSNINQTKVIDYQFAHQEILEEQEKRLRYDLELEKKKALNEIETTRLENEKKISEKIKGLELEKLMHNCSRELFESEKRVLSEKKIIPTDIEPFKSTVLEDIENFLQSSKKDYLHNIQIMVKEAKQRCRELGLDYEFKHIHIANENGQFRNAIQINDCNNSRVAEWLPSRLELWLDWLRENDDISKSNIFCNVDINWKTNQSCNESTLNETINSSKIMLNIDAMKYYSPEKFSNEKQIGLSKSYENISPYKKKSPKNNLTTAKGFLKDLYSTTYKLKKLCQNKKCEDEFPKILLKNIEDIEFVLGEMKLTLNIKEPKDLEFRPNSSKNFR